MDTCVSRADIQTVPSDWLQALALFTGVGTERYTEESKSSAFLLYVLNTKRGQQ